MAAKTVPAPERRPRPRAARRPPRAAWRPEASSSAWRSTWRTPAFDSPWPARPLPPPPVAAPRYPTWSSAPTRSGRRASTAPRALARSPAGTCCGRARTVLVPVLNWPWTASGRSSCAPRRSTCTRTGRRLTGRAVRGWPGMSRAGMRSGAQCARISRRGRADGVVRSAGGFAVPARPSARARKISSPTCATGWSGSARPPWTPSLLAAALL
mmetsp:Transcript_4202/g.13452  ORF Transcript_4202/g.13452 Transcript_4202/m.13452 type:complete len:212 (+) Transcript_4202:309-944(+)